MVKNRYVYLVGLGLLIGGLNADAAQQNGQGQQQPQEVAGGQAAPVAVEQHHNIAELAQAIYPFVAQVSENAVDMLLVMQEHPEQLPPLLLQPLPPQQNQVQQLLAHQAAELALFDAVIQNQHELEQQALQAMHEHGQQQPVVQHQQVPQNEPPTARTARGCSSAGAAGSAK